MEWPSEEWLYGRIEGQTFLKKLCLHLKSELINTGNNSLVPSLDKRFLAKGKAPPMKLHQEDIKPGQVEKPGAV